MAHMRRQPASRLRIDWSNPITQGLAFANVPGLLVDFVSGKAATISGSVTRQGGSIVLPGSTYNGLNVGSGALLGGLSNSSVVAVTSSTVSAAVYCERAPSGNDIYKLELISGSGAVQFTYRNDGGNLLQVQSPADGSTDQIPRLHVATKNGTTHSVYCYQLGHAGPLYSSSGTIGSSSTAFTDAGMVRSIGYDTADSNANFAGRIDVVAGWARTLSVAEIESLRTNPWQIFRAPEDGTELAALALHASAATGGAATTLTPAAAALALTGYAPAIVQPRTLVPSSAALTLTGGVPAVIQPRTLAPGSAALALAGGAPSVVQPQTIAPATAALALTGYAPAVTQVMPQTLAPVSGLLTLATYAPSITQGAQAPAPVSDGGGAGPVREVRAYADLLTRASKPTRSQKKARRRALETEALELLPDLPQAEALAPIAARIVYEQEARALAPLYANRPIDAMAPVVMPFDAHAALRDLVARLLAEAEARHELDAEDEFETELLLLGS